MRRVVFLVNALSDLRPTMTTTRMLLASTRMGMDTWVSELGALAVSDIGEGDQGGQIGNRGQATVWARPMSDAEVSTAEFLEGSLARTTPQPLVLEAGDAFIVRLNPARFGHAAHVSFTTWMLGFLERSGIEVINPVQSLERSANKAFLSEMPQAIRPRQAVVASVEAALFAIERIQAGRHKRRVVVKPARGTRGQGVVFVDPEVTDPRPIVELILERGAVVIQEQLPEPERGDIRVMVVDGIVLDVDGQAMAVRRIPAAGELRSNLHTGGRAELAELGDRELAVLAALRPYLVEAGVRLVGVDLLGGKILELNVWAPGGLGPFEQFTGLDASKTLMQVLLGNGH